MVDYTVPYFCNVTVQFDGEMVRVSAFFFSFLGKDLSFFLGYHDGFFILTGVVL